MVTERISPHSQGFCQSFRSGAELLLQGPFTGSGFGDDLPSAQGVYAAGDVQKPAKGVKAARTGCVFSDAFVVTLYTLPEGFIGRFCQLIANVLPPE